MILRALLQALLMVAVAAALIRAPLPLVEGACLTIRNAVVVLATVVALGTLLYDTLFYSHYRA